MLQQVPLILNTKLCGGSSQIELQGGYGGGFIGTLGISLTTSR
jgi:hypothetical protein